MDEKQKTISDALFELQTHFYQNYAAKPTGDTLEALGKEIRIMHSNQAQLALALCKLLEERESGG